MFYVHNDIFRYQDEVFHDFIDGSCADVAENHAGPGRYVFKLGQYRIVILSIWSNNEYCKCYSSEYE